MYERRRPAAAAPRAAPCLTHSLYAYIYTLRYIRAAAARASSSVYSRYKVVFFCRGGTFGTHLSALLRQPVRDGPMCTHPRTRTELRFSSQVPLMKVQPPLARRMPPITTLMGAPVSLVCASLAKGADS
jgi:hypothetical protein